MKSLTLSLIAMVILIAGVFYWKVQSLTGEELVETEYVAEPIEGKIRWMDGNEKYYNGTEWKVVADRKGVLFDEQRQTWYDPNELLIDIVTDDWSMCAELIICTYTGKELVLNFEGDVLEITGDADMNEAAKVFFLEFLKPMADAYIAERLRNKL